MVSAVDVVLGLILLIIALVLFLIAYDLAKLGLANLRDSYVAMTGSNTGLSDGHVRTKARVIEGPQRKGPLGSVGRLQKITFSQRDWENLLKRHKGVSEEMYDELLYDGVVFEDGNMNRETIAEPDVEAEYEEPSVEYVRPDWTQATRLSGIDDITDDVAEFVSTHDVNGGRLREQLGALESVKIEECSVASNDDIRLIGRLERTEDGKQLTPAGRTVFADTTWRRLSVILFGKSVWSLTISILLTIAAFGIVGIFIVQPLLSAAVLI